MVLGMEKEERKGMREVNTNIRQARFQGFPHNKQGNSLADNQNRQPDEQITIQQRYLFPTHGSKLGSSVGMSVGDVVGGDHRCPP